MQIPLKLAVLGVTAAVFSACNINLQPDASPTPAPTPLQTPLDQGATTTRGTIAELLDRNEPLRCNWISTAEGSQVRGVVYLADNRYRLDAEVAQDQADAQVHVIGTEEMVYQWSEGNRTGFQVSPTALASAQSQLRNTLSPQDERRAVLNLMEETEYTCAEWQVEEAQFEVPATVSFTDISGLLESL
jgi:hypothetical protein